MSDNLALLQNMPIFGGLSQNTLSFLLDHASITSVKKGGYFFREDDKANAMYVLRRGKCVIIKTWEGQNFVLHELHRGDCFGEMALMDMCPRSASVRALDDCEAIEISVTSLHEVYKNNLEQFVILFMNMGREVSRRLRQADNQLFQEKIKA
ncbi:MAG: cyclic nucleotide-binding domain-containing protein [Mariprofundaceae bacterium]